MLAFLGTYSLFLTIVISLPMSWIKDKSYVCRSYLMMLLCFTSSMIILFYALMIDDLSLRYVVENSHHLLPSYLKLSALWGAHSGSWMLMIWYLLLWGILIYRKTMEIQALRGISLVVGVMTLGLCLLDSPFIEQAVYARHAKTLNPLLQDIGMMIHPPVLLMGYIGAIVPWLVLYMSTTIKQSLIFSQQLLSASILSLGIILGAWWSYRVLGWGGYWAWDPIEVISLIPWLTQIVLLHAKSLNESSQYALYFLSAWLAVLCLCLARSDLLNSVHTFSQVSHVSMFFLAVLGCMSFIAWFDQRLRRIVWKDIAKVYHIEMLGFAILLLLTLFLPLMQSIVLGEQFYQKVSVLFTLLLLSKWVKSYKAWLWMIAIAFILSLYLQWFWSSLILVLSIYAIYQQQYSKKSIALIHIGFLSMIVMICIHRHLQSFDRILLQPNEEVELASVGHIHYQGAHVQKNEQREDSFIRLVLNNDKMLLPSISYYPTRDVVVARPSIDIKLTHDIYIALEEVLSDGRISISVACHYYLRLILLSGLMMVVGLIMHWRRYV
jgi:cytochrome c biogenesis factor